MPLDYDQANTILSDTFASAEADQLAQAPPGISADLTSKVERLFRSETQAYREALVGCAVAHIVDPTIDIRLPATEHGLHSFSGRSLADRVVTPFMNAKTIPVSRSPYLSSLRGGARFEPGGQPRIQRDQYGFDTLVELVAHLRTASEADSRLFLSYLLRRFIQLRDASNIPLTRVARLSLEQYSELIKHLLSVPSGGRMPALLAVAMLQAMVECHHLDWVVEWQGINVADQASGAVGDITVTSNGAVVLGVEITERTVDGTRVGNVFNQKILPTGLTDYLFITTVPPDPAAETAARTYFSIGHEVNFVLIHPWLFHLLSAIGPTGRGLFQDKLAALLGAQDIPSDLKVAWNDGIQKAIQYPNP